MATAVHVFVLTNEKRDVIVFGNPVIDKFLGHSFHFLLPLWCRFLHLLNQSEK